MPESSTPYNAGLARRLAEAADSFRDGKFYYFLCKSQYPFELKYTSGHDNAEDASAEADDLLPQLGSEYQKFGPYQTPSAGETLIDYDTLELRFIKEGDVVETQTFEKNTDAIVLNLSAYDKFFQGYYANLYGVDIASGYRQAAASAFSSTPRKSTHHNGGTLFKAGSFEGS